MEKKAEKLSLTELEMTQNEITVMLGFKEGANLAIFYQGFSKGIAQAEIKMKKKEVSGHDLIAVSAVVEGLRHKVCIKRTQHHVGDCTIWRVTIPQFSVKDAVVIAVHNPNHETL